ncbi:MAG TPA: hypothetical protein VFL60_05665 [Gaiellaceae bacterium]|nr:hypothetical protein [Gaiellaceae bacterium]
MELADKVRRPRIFSGRSGPISLRAQAALAASAFLLGAVASGLVFVGVWKHTAAQGDAATAALTATKRQLGSVQASLRQAQADLTAARASIRALRTSSTSLAARARSAEAQLRSTRSAVLPAAAAAASQAGSVARRSAQLRSELSALHQYVGNAPGGVDAGYVAAQVEYLIRSNEALAAGAAAIERSAQAARTAATQRPHHP